MNSPPVHQQSQAAALFSLLYCRIRMLSSHTQYSDDDFRGVDCDKSDRGIQEVRSSKCSILSNASRDVLLRSTLAEWIALCRNPGISNQETFADSLRDEQ